MICIVVAYLLNEVISVGLNVMIVMPSKIYLVMGSTSGFHLYLHKVLSFIS